MKTRSNNYARNILILSALTMSTGLAVSIENRTLGSTPVFAEDKAPTTPMIEMTSTIDQIVKIVETYPDDKGASERRTKLRELINPRFDFAKMAQLSLGSNWNDISPEQRTEFTDIFSTLLAKTYLTKIETVKRGMVTIETESIDAQNQRATVKTLVKNKGDIFPIDYKLSKDKDGWKVYDVVIENIGLVVNYRNEFAGIIRKEKFEGLLDRLKTKTAADTTAKS